MKQFVEKIHMPSGAVAIRTVVAWALVCSITACGGGADDSAVSGTLTRASVTAVLDTNADAGTVASTEENGKPNVFSRGGRVPLYEPIVNSSSSGSSKVLARQCSKRARFAHRTDRVRYDISTRQSLRQAACANAAIG
jgi:hypothetical protein